MANLKEVTVKFGTKTKLVNIDFESLKKTNEIIRARLQLKQRFVLQADSEARGVLYDIDDDQDLDRFKDCDNFVVLLSDDSEASFAYGSTLGPDRPGEAASFGFPPAYEESVEPATEDRSCEVSREKSFEVEIHGVMYPVNAAPPPESSVVQREMIELVSAFDIPGIIRQIDIVAMCMRIALYGVIGKRHLELEVVEMQAKVDDLCNISAKAVKQYGMKTRDILSAMKYAIGCLNEGYESMASDHFRNIVQTSEKLKDTSANLKTFLEDLQTIVQGVCSKVTKENSAHTEEHATVEAEVNSDRKKMLEKRQQQAELDRTEAEARFKALTATGDNLQRVKNVLDQYKRGSCTCEKDECCRNCCSGKFLLCRHTRRYHCVNSKTTEMLQFVTAAECHLLDRELIGRIQALEERDQLRKAEKEAFEELLKFTEALKKDDPLKDPSDSIQDALRGAETGLRTLRSAVQRIINFWDDLGVQSESVITFGGGSFGQMEKQSDEEEREKFFKSRVFQVGTVEYLGKWVALRMMCEAFTEAMEPIQRNLQSSIADNPSRKAALERMPELILALEKKVAERRDTIHVDQKADAELLKSLMSGVVKNT
ncbi:uncharacterized protein LOC135503185 [Lineus longissimus]|uniref:uncharacterized protein LOC135503185 n=1 Tax=Lineus longissimus TaxID=88925 RepID=UPI00315CE67F